MFAPKRRWDDTPLNERKYNVLIKTTLAMGINTCYYVTYLRLTEKMH